MTRSASLPWNRPTRTSATNRGFVTAIKEGRIEAIADV